MALCEHCGEHEAVYLAQQHPRYDGWAAWMGYRYPALCQACWTEADNAEPGEPDGEAFRGGEAAAYEAEEMARVQRELK